MGLVGEGMRFTPRRPVETRARVRVAGEALEEDDGHTIAPLYRDDRQDKGNVRYVFKETAGTGT